MKMEFSTISHLESTVKSSPAFCSLARVEGIVRCEETL